MTRTSIISLAALSFAMALSAAPARAETCTYTSPESAGLPKPPGPIPFGREERNAMAGLAADPTDPFNVARWKPLVDAWAAERARQYALAKELYDKQLTEFFEIQKERRWHQAWPCKP